MRVQAPIVLVHGLLGFDQLQVNGWAIADYFPGIKAALEAAGNVVFIARLSPTAGIENRAQQLAEFIRTTLPNQKLHFMAHSMGGLDCRHAIRHLGLAEQTLSLTTLGTPHRGSAFADWGMRRLAPSFVPLLQQVGIDAQAFADLTTEACTRFNANTPDVAGVRYFSVAASFEVDWFCLEWSIPYKIILQTEGPNDGLVSVASATYGENCLPWVGDHASLVNWPNPIARARGKWRDRASDYLELVSNLVRAGF